MGACLVPPRVLFLFLLPLVFSACAKNQNIIFPVVAGTGSINGEAILNYDTMAVFKFTDAPDAPNSGATVAGLLSNVLTKLGFTVVERTRLDQIMDEQITLASSGSKNPLTIGKFAGAKAIVVGEVGQWETHRRKTDTTYFANKGMVVPIQGQQWDETYVSLSLRIISVEDGTVVFSGDGHFPKPIVDPPQKVAQIILDGILGKLVELIRPSPSKGKIGIRYEPRSFSDGWLPAIVEVASGSPAEQAGLRAGDLIKTCNSRSLQGKSKLAVHVDWSKLCRLNPEESVKLEVVREFQLIQVSETPVARNPQ
ncbi:MAG TPA: CsgG/HfaB family protein [Nitrospiraceae bacterium]|nr:CsgG/HfaB family protein [Nitrospiraceae bacterium]